jgi:UDP-N-acetylglucosamine 2-epimerase (non-hydrolysing)
MFTVSIIFGTRPEAIKLAPVILALKNEADLACRVCITGQHREMLDPVLKVFDIKPDADLGLMRPNQSLADLTARGIESLDRYLAQERPDLVLVQGDTTSVFCATLAAFYRRIPVGHVEAGLRTWNLQAPWPEEANRVLTSRLATLHFAPTETARQNLLREAVPDEAITVTGNTVIDALFMVMDTIEADRERSESLLASLALPPEFAERFLPVVPRVASEKGHGAKLVLVTGHRRESFGEGFERICAAIRQLVELYPDLGIIYPVHLNPHVQAPVRRNLGSHERIQLIPPLGYEVFVWLMSRAYFVLSDSGGVQEEAPSLGKPVLVLRETTERPEGVTAGTCRLVGTDPERILSEARVLLTDAKEYARRSRLKNPYGDGQAARRIVNTCAAFHHIS